MTKRIVITPKASADLDKHFEYLAQYNIEAALSFFDAARQTFALKCRYEIRVGRLKSSL
jgi:toxin ParE1/3/4